LGKFFSSQPSKLEAKPLPQGSDTAEAAERGEDSAYLKAQRQYSEMKRLHTSKGTRVTKYRASRVGDTNAEIEDNKGRPLNNNSTYESILDRSKINFVSPHRQGPENEKINNNLTRPPQTAPSSEM